MLILSWYQIFESWPRHQILFAIFVIATGGLTSSQNGLKYPFTGWIISRFSQIGNFHIIYINQTCNPHRLSCNGSKPLQLKGWLFPDTSGVAFFFCLGASIATAPGEKHKPLKEKYWLMDNCHLQSDEKRWSSVRGSLFFFNSILARFDAFLSVTEKKVNREKLHIWNEG